MKKTNKVIITSVIVAVLLLGIGYAAIQNITLNIAGTAAADPSQANFKVMFTGTPIVSDDTYATAAIADDTNATINVEGLTKKGDIVTATYTVQNASEDLSADLAVSTTNTNTEFFTLSSDLATTSLVAGEETTLTVTAELTKTPITDSVSATIGVKLKAMPVQPGEEGTSVGINGSSQTPTPPNQYGFYFDKFYANQDEGLGFIAHEDGSVEWFEYMLADDMGGLDFDEWMCIDYFDAGEMDYDEMIVDGTMISKGSNLINMNGVDYELSNVDSHGVYFDSEYTAAINDTMSYEMIIEENGSVKLTVYENGIAVGSQYVPNAFVSAANNYIMLIENDVELVLDVTGENIYWYNMEMTFTLTGSKCDYVSEIIKEPNYSNGECIDGEMKYTCPVCGDSYVGPIPAVHTDEDVDGICDNCGESITYIDFSLNSSNAYMIGYTQETTDLFIPATFYKEDDDTYYKITYINNYAFEEEANLKTVTFADNSQVEEIDFRAFAECTNLISINIPDSIMVIGQSSFEGCTALESVILGENSSLTTVERFAFTNCTSLSNIYITKNVTSLPYDAFGGCQSLESFEADEENTVFASIDGILYSKDMTKLKMCPKGKKGNVIVPDSVAEIASYSFENCTKVTDIKLPDNLQYIGTDAFDSCTSLTNMVIPNSVSKMDSGIFSSCKNLTTATLPTGMTEIPWHMFNGCTNLTSIVIPDGYTYIGVCAFYNCTSLSNVSIPETVTTFDGDAFENTAWIAAQKEINPLVIVNNILIDGTAASGDVVIPDGVTSIQATGFDGNTALVSVVIPNSCKSIDSYAFQYCNNLTSVTLPNNLSKIDFSLFEGCTKLSNIDLPESVTSIYANAFEGCSSLTNIEIPPNVTYLDSEAFKDCTSLTSIVLPNKLKTLGYYAFNGCKKLESVTIPTSITKIEHYAFLSCDSLKTVNYTGTKQQWNSIFIGTFNEDLTNATINYNYVIPTE